MTKKTAAAPKKATKKAAPKKSAPAAKTATKKAAAPKAPEKPEVPSSAALQAAGQPFPLRASQKEADQRRAVGRHLVARVLEVGKTTYTLAKGFGVLAVVAAENHASLTSGTKKLDPDAISETAALLRRIDRLAEKPFLSDAEYQKKARTYLCHARKHLTVGCTRKAGKSCSEINAELFASRTGLKAAS